MTGDTQFTRRTLLGSGAGAATALLLGTPHVWAQRAPERQTATFPGWTAPENFGAVGDGVADDTDAVRRALHSGFGVALVGTYRLTEPIVFGTGFTEQPSMLQGLGRDHFIVDHAEGDALHFDCGEIGISTGNALTARDFGLLSGVAGTPHGALTVTASGGTGSVYRTFDITNVHTSATDQDRGFRTGIRLVNQRHGVVRGCIHNGVRNVVPGERQGSAIAAEGDGESHPVDFTIENCQAYFAGCGVHLIGTHEGITIDKHSAVGCDEGVLVEADEHPLDGGNAGKPLFWITNGHFQTFRTGMRLMRARDFIVTGNDLLVEQPNTSWTGLIAEVGDAASQYGWIDGNKFQDASRVGNSDGTTTGIMLNGAADGVLDTRIGVNRYVNLSVGMHLEENARRVFYADASLYAAVATPIVDQGSGNASY
ncbi:hypothetical protein [Rhizobium sp. EC-SD404]|uniref:hypothetical protein n=1 Tax=Rhizobium sp. EC-SD404 TaxID=2038389 RepID=UPI001254E0AD|nr:hypothetical protein [Rhizobium sp. EC-SD404]VVT32658.1 hypothetical protein RHIZ404_230597 [Rhizobium sp. EC-SD404]